jgi:hypothetical protein
VVAAFPFSSELLSWEAAVVTAEVAGLLPERAFGLVPGSSR